MKKLFKNKKILLSLAVAGIIAASGLTYAWFRQTIETQANNVNMGALHLNAEITLSGDINNDDYYSEPGENGYTTYQFTNPKTYATIPTVDALVKLDTASDMFVRLVDWGKWEALNDEDAPLDGCYYPIEKADADFFDTYLKVKGFTTGEWPFGMTSDDQQVTWMLLQTNDAYNTANGLDTPDVYLYVLGGRSAGETVVVPAIEMGVKLLGADPTDPEIGLENNPYMGAQILYGCVWDDTNNEWVENPAAAQGQLVVTQAKENWTTEDDPDLREFIEGAPYSEWGVTTADFDEPYIIQAAPGTVSAYSAANGITAAQAFQMVLNQIRN